MRVTQNMMEAYDPLRRSCSLLPLDLKLSEFLVKPLLPVLLKVPLGRESGRSLTGGLRSDAIRAKWIVKSVRGTVPFLFNHYCIAGCGTASLTLTKSHTWEWRTPAGLHLGWPFFPQTQLSSWPPGPPPSLVQDGPVPVALAACGLNQNRGS